MTPYYEHAGISIYHGDCREVLRSIPDAVHCCITSPPYWGLRDYGTAAQIGLEKTPAEYVSRMVEVFREVRRILRDDGTVWLNLGDCYVANRGNSAAKPGHDNKAVHESLQIRSYRIGGNGLKEKDLVGIPWSVAFALRADGWYLRSDIIWAKPNPMPESVTDRPTKAHEYLFLLAKSEQYYYDHEAIKEPAVFAGRPRGGTNAFCGQGQNRPEGSGRANRKGRELAAVGGGDCRNKRSVWTVPTQPYPEAHFATFPEDLINPCILAGCPKGGIVLDPFVGSGTTLLVAKRLGCKGIGAELNADYIEMAAKRLSQEVFSFEGVPA